MGSRGCERLSEASGGIVPVDGGRLDDVAAVLRGGTVLRTDDRIVVVAPAGAVLGGTYVGGRVCPADVVGRKPPVEPVDVFRVVGAPPRSPTRLNNPPPLLLLETVGITNEPDESRRVDILWEEGWTFIDSCGCAW